MLLSVGKCSAKNYQSRSFFHFKANKSNKDDYYKDYNYQNNRQDAYCMSGFRKSTILFVCRWGRYERQNSVLIGVTGLHTFRIVWQDPDYWIIAGGLLLLSQIELRQISSTRFNVRTLPVVNQATEAGLLQIPDPLLDCAVFYIRRHDRKPFQLTIRFIQNTHWLDFAASMLRLRCLDVGLLKRGGGLKIHLRETSCFAICSANALQRKFTVKLEIQFPQ